MEGGREKLCCRARNGGVAARGRKFCMAVAGRRSRRSRSPIRHASSSPQRTWPMPTGQEEHADGNLPPPHPAEHCCGRTVSLSQCQSRNSVATDRPEWELPPVINPVSCARDSSPGGYMRQQTKPFTVEIKQSRKLKPTDRKTSIWGKLDLTPDQGALKQREPREVSAVGGCNDRR